MYSARRISSEGEYVRWGYNDEAFSKITERVGQCGIHMDFEEF